MSMTYTTVLVKQLSQILPDFYLFFLFVCLFDCDSLYGKLNSHCKAGEKNIKAHSKSL